MPTIEGESNRRESPVTHLLAAPNVPHYASATGSFKLIWLLLPFPLIGAAVLLLGGKRTDKWGHYLGVADVRACSFVLGVILFFALKGHVGRHPVHHQTCSAGSRSTASTSRPDCCSTSCPASSSC